MIKGFKATEKIVRFIEADNTIVVEVDRRDSKAGIMKEAENKFKVKVERVNTLVKDNKKYAYIKLDKKNPAIDVATKFGII